MSSNRLSLRLLGELPPPEELNRVLGTTPTVFLSRGTPITRSGRVIQPEDVWQLYLAEWEGVIADISVLTQAAATLRWMAPALVALDRTKFRVELVVSITQFGEDGGCDLPYELIASAAAANLDFEISVLAVPDLEDADDA
jgi:hypothetical protein